MEESDLSTKEDLLIFEEVPCLRKRGTKFLAGMARVEHFLYADAYGDISSNQHVYHGPIADLDVVLIQRIDQGLFVLSRILERFDVGIPDAFLSDSLRFL